MLLQMSIFHSFYGATSFYAFLANGTATARMTWLPGSVSISARTQKNTKSSSSSPMGSVSLKLSLEPVLSPPTFWQTGPSGPISNPTGPISLPLHTFIPALPSLPPFSENSETNIISHQVDFIFFSFLMYGVGIIVTSVLLASTQRQDPRRILRSLAMPSSHWLPTGPAGMTGVSTLSGTPSGPF